MRRSFKKWTAQHLEQKWLSRSVLIGKPLPALRLVPRPPLSADTWPGKHVARVFLFIYVIASSKYFNMLAFKLLV